MRRALVAFAVVVAAGSAAVAIHLASTTGDRAFSLGVLSSGVAEDLRGGQTACQRRIDVPETGGFSQVSAILGTHQRPGPRLRADVVRGGRVIASGTLPAGYPDLTNADLRKRMHVRPFVAGGQTVDICFTDEGHAPLAFFGGAYAAPPRTYAEVGGKRSGSDLDLIFYCGCGRSELSHFSQELRNASLFKFAGAGLWLAILWMVVVVLGLPVLLALSLTKRAQGR